MSQYVTKWSLLLIYCAFLGLNKLYTKQFTYIKKLFDIIIMCLITYKIPKFPLSVLDFEIVGFSKQAG